MPDLSDDPENLIVERHNLNRSLTNFFRGENIRFDLINSSFVGPGIHTARWGAYASELKSMTAKRGWVQMMEYDYQFQSDNGSLTDNHDLMRWYAYYYDAMVRRGGNRNPSIGGQLQAYMSAAGFVNVQGTILKAPIGGWLTGMIKSPRVVRCGCASIFATLLRDAWGIVCCPDGQVR
jgi:hypothetical protein